MKQCPEHSDPFPQYLVSLIEAKLGWMCVFYFFIAMVGHTGISLVFCVRSEASGHFVKAAC